MKITKPSRLLVLILAGAFAFTSCQKDECEVDESLTPTAGYVTEISANHHKVYTDIVINASAEEVWSVLTNWADYSNWRTTDGFMGISGNLVNGNTIDAQFRFGTNTVNIPHTLIYVEGVRFGWSDPTGPAIAPPFGGFVDNHIYEVQPISECQSRFIQTDEYNGVGNSVNNSESIANLSLPAFQEFNAELKAEVEK